MKKTLKRIIAMLLLMTIWSVAIIPTPFLGKYVSTITMTDALALDVKAPDKNEVFAVFDSSDGSLRFYNRASFALSDTQTKYEGFDTTANTHSWTTDQGINVLTVSVEDTGISPVSTVSWFDGLSGLQSADLSKLDTSNVATMDNMFKGCSSLSKVLVSESWTTADVTSANQIFEGCNSLKGGAGTSVTGVDMTYARIDGGTAAPGYLTYYKYAVIFDANGGTGAPIMMLSQDGSFTMPATETTSASGYSFMGWSTNKDAWMPAAATGGTFRSNGTAPCCETLYAVYDRPVTTDVNELFAAIDAGKKNIDIEGGSYSYMDLDGLTTGLNITMNNAKCTSYIVTSRNNNILINLCDFTQSSNTTLIRIGRNSTVTINNANTKNNNGEVATIDYYGTLIINGGTYNRAVLVRGGYSSSNLTINGGTFTNVEEVKNLVGDVGNVTITGGTFGFDPTDSGYVAGGCNVVNNGNGTWTVVDSSTLDLLEKEAVIEPIEWDYSPLTESSFDWWTVDNEALLDEYGEDMAEIYLPYAGYDFSVGFNVDDPAIEAFNIDIDGVIYRVVVGDEKKDGEPFYDEENEILTIPAKLLTEETKSLVITAVAVEIDEQTEEKPTDEEQKPTEETDEKEDETEADKSEDTSNGDTTTGGDTSEEIKKEFNLDTTDLENAEIKCTFGEDGNAKLVIKANNGYTIPETFIIAIGGTEYEIDTTTDEQEDGIVWDSETGTLTIPKDLVCDENVEIGVKLQAIIKEDDDEEADKKPDEDKNPDGDDSTEDTDDTTSGGTEGEKPNDETAEGGTGTDDAEQGESGNVGGNTDTENSGNADTENGEQKPDEDTETDTPVIPPVTDVEQTGGNNGEENDDGTDEGGEENGNGDNNVPPATEETPAQPPVTEDNGAEENGGETGGEDTSSDSTETGGTDDTASGGTESGDDTQQGDTSANENNNSTGESSDSESSSSSGDNPGAGSSSSSAPTESSDTPDSSVAAPSTNSNAQGGESTSSGSPQGSSSDGSASGGNGGNNSINSATATSANTTAKKKTETSGITDGDSDVDSN